MLCDVCGKNAATVHLTEIVDNQMAELHLCEECARQKSLQMEQQFGLADLLAGLADFGEHIGNREEVKLKCSRCGLTYEGFRKSGRLGCGECYNSFRQNLASLLKKIHGSSKHLGKVPAKLSKTLKKRTELQELKNKLQRAIQLEEFEEAAKLRDRIKELEGKARQ
jgi:protein arginine kinase activator